MTERLWRRVGRRGFTLLFLFLLDSVYALSLLQPPDEARHTSTIRYIAALMPLPVWAAVWAAVGLLCLVEAFRRCDRLAFAAAVTLKTLWGAIFFFGWLIQGLDRGWVSAVIWIAFAAFVYVVSGWPESSTEVRDEPR
jgi:hypothetical protein